MLALDYPLFKHSEYSHIAVADNIEQAGLELGSSRRVADLFNGISKGLIGIEMVREEVRREVEYGLVTKRNLLRILPQHALPRRCGNHIMVELPK